MSATATMPAGRQRGLSDRSTLIAHAVSRASKEATVREKTLAIGIFANPLGAYGIAGYAEGASSTAAYFIAK